jgi:hypothetical protein
MEMGKIILAEGEFLTCYLVFISKYKAEMGKIGMSSWIAD